MILQPYRNHSPYTSAIFLIFADMYDDLRTIVEWDEVSSFLLVLAKLFAKAETSAIRVLQPIVSCSGVSVIVSVIQSL